MAYARKSIKVLIADDRAIMRDLLKTILRGLSDVDVTIIEASDDAALDSRYANSPRNTVPISFRFHCI